MSSGTDTWRLRKYSGGVESTLDIDVDRNSFTNTFGNVYTTTVELSSPITVAADDGILIKRQTSGGNLIHVGAHVYVAFDL